MEEFLNNALYLPRFLRDFDDQKLFFKMFHLKTADFEPPFIKPNWINGQIYIIDFFLWFMAKRGYTLQKSRQKLDFVDIEKEIYDYYKESMNSPFKY